MEQASPIDEPEGPLGLRLIPLVAGPAFRLEHEVPVILMTRERGVVELDCRGRRHLLDGVSWMVLPARTRATISAPISAALIVLLVHHDVRRRAAQTYAPHVDPVALEGALREPTLLERTRWVHELTHRYLFERAVCKKRGTLATEFIEVELIKELYFNVREQGDRVNHLKEVEPLVARALGVIEAHLLEPITMASVASACSTSSSTLLRAFRRELGVAPSTYLRQRRLEESVLLLKSGRYSVSEVATLVAYDNLAAFSHAFRARFGQSPSQLRRRASGS